MSGVERRRSFRVEETVYLAYEVISDRDFHQGLERWKMRKGTSSGIRSSLLDIDSRFNEKMFLLQSETRELAECLNLLNEKINIVLNELPHMRESKAALASSAPQKCQLGADGMLFATDKQYPEGTRMFVRFLLIDNNRYVETFSRVVRSVDMSSEEHPGPAYGVAVEFQGMKSAEKDILIQHLFNRESETLRMRRLQLEAVE